MLRRHYISMILYQQLAYQCYMIWYHIQYISLIWSAWLDMMPKWCIIIMKVYDIKMRYISIKWCMSAIWYISMTWHDSSMKRYSVSNLCNWYQDFSVCWPFGVPVFGVSAFRVLTRQCWCIEDIAASYFEQQTEWDIVKGKFLFAFSAQR